MKTEDKLSVSLKFGLGDYLFQKEFDDGQHK